MRMLIRALIVAFLTAATGLPADWNQRLAAHYLDSRQQAWFASKTAASANGPCVSCHTGPTCLLARHALRSRLSEPDPTEWETGLLDRLRSHAGEKRPGNLQGVEATFTALFLARNEKAAAALSPDTRHAFDQM